MELKSSKFQNGATLDAVYTVEGRDISPPLEWSEPPAETRSFAIICDDPDAPSARHPGPDPWVHWVMFNIPAETTKLSAGMSHEAEPSEVPGAMQGRNSWPADNIGYRGPAPPPGSGPHRYVFRIYALDSLLPLPAGASKSQVLRAMKKHILAESPLIGIYER
jgi:Raf kinase inhibitor-like YbhB/YbcL family protein